MARMLLASVTLWLLITSAVAATTEADKVSAPKDEVQTLEAQSEQAFADENWVKLYVANRKLEKLRPWDPKYMINIVRATGMLDRKNTAYHYMLAMQTTGMSYDFNQWPETENLRSTEIYNYVNDLMIKAGEPGGEVNTAWTVKDDASNFRSLAWDGSRDRFLTGRSDGGEVHAFSAKGKKHKTLLKLKQGAGAIESIAVDTQGNRLWVSRGDVLEYELDSLKLLQVHQLGGEEADIRAGSIAVAKQGQLFVLGLDQPLVFRKPANGEKFEMVEMEGMLEQPTDLTISSDGNRVYVADRVVGIVMIDALALLPFEVKGPDNLNMGMIESINYVDNKLIVMQSGFQPQRLMRLNLDATGSMVEMMAPMAVAREIFDAPRQGVVMGEDVYYFANSAATASKLIVAKTPLDAGDDIVPPDSRAIKEALEQNRAVQ